MNLLASSAVALDIAFFVIMAIGLLFGVVRGFVKCVFKWAGLVGSVFLAFTFCNAFQRTLDEWFGLTEALISSINNETLGGWLSLIISFFIILIGANLIAWIVGALGTLLVQRVKVFGVINKVLGGVWGLFEAPVLVFLLLMICGWINSDAINGFILESSIVGKIYASDWFEWAVTLPFFS